MVFKDKIHLDLKDYKYKTDTTLNNFQVKLDYLTKNANAFTTSSVRASEKKMEKLFNNQLDEFKAELNGFKNEFNSFIDIQEDKLIHIIENSKKIESFDKIKENSKKIENLEKGFENLKEITEKIEQKQKEMKNIKSKDENNNLEINNNNENNENNENKENKENDTHSKTNKVEIFNDFTKINATSILKEYINGKITENEIYKRRKSIVQPMPRDLQAIKENDNITNNNNLKALKSS